MNRYKATGSVSLDELLTDVSQSVYSKASYSDWLKRIFRPEATIPCNCFLCVLGKFFDTLSVNGNIERPARVDLERLWLLAEEAIDKAYIAGTVAEAKARKGL